MSPYSKPSRELKSKDSSARRSSAFARPLKASALLLVAAAFTQLYPYAPFALFAPASFAQKQDEQKKYEELKRVEEQKRLEEQKQPPVEIPIPGKRREATPVADRKLITLCPGEPARVRLATRPPVRGRWYSAEGVGEVIKVDTEEGTAVWDLSGAKQGTYAASFKSDFEPLTHAPAPLTVRVTVRECTKQTPTPTPQGNDNGASGALTPTPSATPTPSPTPNTSPSPTPTTDATPPEVSGASTPEVSASPTPTGEGFALSWRTLVPLLLLTAALTLVVLRFALKKGNRGGTHRGTRRARPRRDSEMVAGEEAAGGLLVGGVTKERDEVLCTVFSPLKVSPGDSFLVQVFAHLAAQARKAAALARDADPDAGRRDSAELDARVERGEELVFELTMRGLEVQEPTAMRLVWNGKPKSVKFDVRVPEDCQPKSVTGTVAVNYLSVPVASLRFKLDIVPRAQAAAGEADRARTPEQKFKRYRYAFISYASEDRAEVLRRVQVLPLVAIEYFQDITSLDPGDRWAKKLYGEIDKSDVFFLFWSKAARDSEWVEKEVLYAIERKHGDEDAAPDIKPVILEGPPPVTPQERLRSLHFNDKMIYFISVEDSLRAARNEGTPPGGGVEENAV